ncbi:MAG: hypothetical protein AB8B56_00925 [Crocinitomicaceae bacterium]
MHRFRKTLYLCNEIKIHDGLRNENATLLNTTFSICLADNSTLEVYIDHDLEFELEHAIQLNDKIYEIGSNEKYYQLTIYGDRTVPSKEARTYSISKEGSQHKLAEAIVVTSLSQKMVFNFMINIERPLVRTKLFTHVDEAKKWLNSLKD